MKHIKFGIFAAILASLAQAGCSAQSNSAEGGSAEIEKKAEVGELAMSLRATSNEGTVYRLRNAVFSISGYYYYYYNGDAGSPDSRNYTATSEEHLSDSSINLSVDQGSYSVDLASGWYMERLNADGSSERVEAQLLNDSYQYLYVSPHRTSWVAYNFGIGGHKLWFNGEAQISIGVYEDPDDYYGGPSPSYNYPSMSAYVDSSSSSVPVPLPVSSAEPASSAP